MHFLLKFSCKLKVSLDNTFLYPKFPKYWMKSNAGGDWHFYQFAFFIVALLITLAWFQFIHLYPKSPIINLYHKKSIRIHLFNTSYKLLLSVFDTFIALCAVTVFLMLVPFILRAQLHLPENIHLIPNSITTSVIDWSNLLNTNLLPPNDITKLHYLESINHSQWDAIQSITKYNISTNSDELFKKFLENTLTSEQTISLTKLTPSQWEILKHLDKVQIDILSNLTSTEIYQIATIKPWQINNLHHTTFLLISGTRALLYVPIVISFLIIIRLIIISYAHYNLQLGGYLEHYYFINNKPNIFSSWQTKLRYILPIRYFLTMVTCLPLLSILIQNTFKNHLHFILPNHINYTNHIYIFLIECCFWWLLLPSIFYLCYIVKPVFDKLNRIEKFSALTIAIFGSIIPIAQILLQLIKL